MGIFGKVFSGTGNGWFGESLRHSNAQLFGSAGPIYRSTKKMNFQISGPKINILFAKSVAVLRERVPNDINIKQIPTQQLYKLTTGPAGIAVNGSGEIIGHFYNEGGKTFKLPEVSPIKQREEVYTESSMAHPAKMNTILSQRIIQKFTKPGDVILDPMAGIGTTGIEASRLGRNAVMVDYEPRFVNISKRNVELLKKSGQQRGSVKVYKGDSRNLSFLKNKKVDMVVTSPPFSSIEPFQDKKFKLDGREVGKTNSGGTYSHNKKNKKQLANLKYGKIDAVITSPPFEKTMPTSDGPYYQKNFKHVGSVKLHQNKYSNDPNNIGQMKGETYLSEIQKVYKECHDVLKPGGVMVLHTKNFVRNKKEVHLDKDTIRLAKSAGFKFKDRYKRKVTNPSFWARTYHKKYPNAPRIEHEDLLVFRKS